MGAEADWHRLANGARADARSGPLSRPGAAPVEPGPASPEDRVSPHLLRARSRGHCLPRQTVELRHYLQDRATLGSGCCPARRRAELQEPEWAPEAQA